MQPLSVPRLISKGINQSLMQCGVSLDAMKLERITVSPQLVAIPILHGQLPKTIPIYLKLSTAILQSFCLTPHNANTDIYRRRTLRSQLSKLTKSPQ